MMHYAALTFSRELFSSSSSTSRFRVLKNDSAQTLSQQLPLRNMLLTNIGSAAVEASRNAAEQHWTPRSEWNSNRPRGCLIITAIMNASMTIVAVISVRIDQPTTLRSYRSVITHRYNHPFRVGRYVMSETHTVLGSATLNCLFRMFSATGS